MDAEQQADRAANEIVDLVEQEVQRSACPLTGPSLSPDMHISAHSIATDTMEWLAYAEQKEEEKKEEEEIPEWVITESREMNREVTPPVQFFFCDQGDDRTGIAGRRQPLAPCTISTVRQVSHGWDWNHSLPIVLFVN